MAGFKMFNPPEDKITFESFIKFSLFLFRLIFFEFNSDIENASVKVKIVRNLKAAYFKLVIVSSFAATGSLFAYAVFSSTDFFDALKSIQDVLTMSMISLRTVVTFLNKDDIWEICQELKAMYETHRNENVKYGVKKHLDWYHFLNKIYAGTFVATSSSVIFPLFPFLISGTMKPAIDYWFPFDVSQPETFPIALFFADWITYSCSVALIATDTMLYALISVIALEFDVLRLDLMNLKFVSENERRKNIQDLTDRHNKLHNLSEKLQSIYGINFWFNFVVSSIIMCLLMFQLSTAIGLATYMFYISYFSLMSGQILLMCLFGQKLIDSSLAVADGAYNCGWEEFADETFKKQIVLIVRRAQKPQRLTALKFADISLQTFTTVSF